MPRPAARIAPTSTPTTIPESIPPAGATTVERTGSGGVTATGAAVDERSAEDVRGVDADVVPELAAGATAGSPSLVTSTGEASGKPTSVAPVLSVGTLVDAVASGLEPDAGAATEPSDEAGAACA